jgi:hypothetical protein
MRGIAIIAAAALTGATGTGCEDDPAGTPDGMPEPDGPPGPCWPEQPLTPQGGSAVLGTGRDGFEPMPDTLPLEYGAQDGFMLVTNVRMSGFEPGNPQDILDRRNPRTRVRAFFEDTNVPLNYYLTCPFRTAYVPDGAEYRLIEAAPVVFETCWRSVHLFGKRIRVELEITDDSGAYATDVKIVTAAPPTGPYVEDTGPGCIH